MMANPVRLDFPRECPANLRACMERALEKYPLATGSLKHILSEFDSRYFEFADALLQARFRHSSEDAELDRAVEAFVKYTHEFMVLQMKLRKTKQYLHSSFEEVNQAVYQNSLMNDYYLDGLLLSQVLWPNHYKMLVYFEDFIQSHSFEQALEVPVGTGVYSWDLIHRSSFKGRLDCFDISSHSIEFAKNLIGDTPRYEVENVFNQDGSYDLIVCGELLEHLENPQDLLEKLLALLKKDGRVFLTTAIFAAAIDHIYLFRDATEVREMLTQYFAIESELVLPVSLKPHQEGMRDEPINYACILKSKEDSTI